MEKVGLIGWNGKYNIGDDAMTSVIVRYLANGQEAKSFYFLADNNALADYTGQNQQIVIKGIPGYHFFERIPYLRTVLLQYIFPYFFSNDKNLLLFGGGTIFHRARLSKFYQRIIKRARKKNPSILIGGIGISLGPFKNEEEKEAAKKCLDSMDFFVVRDTRSYKLAQELGINTRFSGAPDLALLLPKLHNKCFAEKRNFGNYIGLSLRSGYFDAKKSWIIDIMLQLSVMKPGYKFKLFNFCILKGQNDMEENRKLFNSLPAGLSQKIEIVEYSRDPFEFYKEIYTCDLMLCMRLHAAIISYAVNTKFAILSYHQKCIDFAKEVGLPDKYLLDEKMLPLHVAELLLLLLVENEIPFSKSKEEIMNSVENHFFFIPNQ